MSSGLSADLRGLGTLFAGMRISNDKSVTPGGVTLSETRSRDFIVRSVVDTYDKAVFPKKGKFHIMDFELSQDVLGGDFSASKQGLSLESCFTEGAFTFTPHISAGYSAGTLPVWKDFSLGYYFPFWGLRGDERRNAGIIQGDLNVRFCILKGIVPVYAESGISIGETWKRGESPDFKEPVIGSGFSLHVETPLGPLTFTFGDTNTLSPFWNISLGRKHF